MIKQSYILLFLLLSQLTGTAQNYDESKVGTYQLPSLLKKTSSSQSENKKNWESTRREEVLTLFKEHVYGHTPTDFDRIEFKTFNVQRNAMGGLATLKETQISVYRDAEKVTINTVQFTPNTTTKPCPIFLLINNRPARNTAPQRDTISGFWPAEMAIENGFGMIAFQVNDAAPDNKTNFKDGVLKLYPDETPKPNSMKAIGAWAWAASRVMDYLETDASVDDTKVIVVGHSRGGKTSLWAAAQDPRFAMAITNNSGNTGAALSKRNYGETVKIINTAFPHWFNDNYKKYNDNEKALPIDQHMLLALIAPRPLYVTSASEDRWADPTGTFLALKEAEKAYEWYGIKKSLSSNEPPVNTPLHTPSLGYHIRQGKHNMDFYDWEQFIQFAKKQFP